jgi:hypothetical protein
MPRLASLRLPVIWLCSAFNWPTLAASVGATPAATLVIWRSCPGAPTETVLGRVAIEPWPSATELLPLTATKAFAPMAVELWPSALAPAPMATEFVPLAVLFAPRAELLLPLAVLFAPTAELLSPLAVLFAPSAELLLPLAVLFAPSVELLLPLAVLFAPTAELLSPLAVLLSPTAVPVAPTVAEPVSNTTLSPLESSDVELSAVCARPALMPTARLTPATAINPPYRNSLSTGTLFADALSIFDAMTHTPPLTVHGQHKPMKERTISSKLIIQQSAKGNLILIFRERFI